jgi:hypothetical protein
MVKNLKFHVIAISAICVLVVLLSQWVAPAPQNGTQAASGNRYVRVVSASWGLNCNPFIAEAKQLRESSPLQKDENGNIITQPPIKEVARDNVLTKAKSLCEGKPACQLMATSEVLGFDPMESCFKKLNFNYRCFEMDRLQAAETSQGEMLRIDCVTPAASDAPPTAAVQP